MTTAVTGPTSSVPALQEASQLALTIVNASQNIRRNKTAFNRLANDNSEFVDDMINFYRIMEGYFPLGVPEELAVIFQEIVNSLKSIQTFTHEVASRNSLMALLFSHSDMREIKSQNLTLSRNKDLFKIISNNFVQKLATSFSAETMEFFLRRLGVEETN